MTYFLKNGTSYRISSRESMDLHEILPAGNYIIKQEPMTGEYFLESINDFVINYKTYGNHTRNCDRILQTFLDRPNTTGVMLAGEKGSGKSLLAKAVSISGVDRGIPTIVINSPFHGDRFNSFIQSIDQECIVLFDEFEKTYDRETQESILTLLDGVFPSKKLFLLTCNDKWRIDSNMRNRPGRIYYMIDFAGLDKDFIHEYCVDNLKDQQHIEKIAQISCLFSEFNFDMLKALVEEMNRYNEPPEQALKILNAKPEFDESKCSYSIDLIVEGIPIDPDLVDTTCWTGNPLRDNIHVEFKKYETNNASDTESDESDCERDNWDWKSVSVAPSDLKKIDSNIGRFVFVNDQVTFVLTKIKEKKASFYNAF